MTTREESGGPLPCPWCGKATKVCEGQGVGFKKEERYVACPGDHWFCGRGPMMKNEAEAIAAWNRVAARAAPDAGEGDVAEGLKASSAGAGPIKAVPSSAAPSPHPAVTPPTFDEASEAWRGLSGAPAVTPASEEDRALVERAKAECDTFTEDVYDEFSYSKGDAILVMDDAALRRLLALAEIGMGVAGAREARRMFASLMATACWRSEKHGVAGMGGEAVHFAAVRQECAALGVEFSPRDADVAIRVLPAPQREEKGEKR